MLVKELTDAIVDKDARRKNFVSSLIKEAFGSSTILGKELEYYRTLVETTDLELYLAEKLLQETKMAHSLLDSKKVFNTQTKIINKINKDSVIMVKGSRSSSMEYIVDKLKM